MSVALRSEEEKKRGEMTRQTRFKGEREVEVFTGKGSDLPSASIQH